MNILVTGGAGFIGSHIVDALISKGHSVVIIDNLITGNKHNMNSEAIFLEKNILDNDLSEVFKQYQIEVVYHEAAQLDVRKSVEDPMFDAQQNILGSINLFEASRKNNIKKFIFASTGGVMYGDTNKIPTPESEPALPICPYGVCKRTIEKYAYYYQQIYGLSYVALRYGNVYGPRQNPHGEAGVIAIFTDYMLNQKQCFINGDGTIKRDYVYIDDVVQANMLALERDVQGIFNVGTGIETDVNKLFDLIKSNTGSQIQKSYRPGKKGEQQRSCLDYNKIQEQLGWQPTVMIDEGIKRTVNWFKNS